MEEENCIEARVGSAQTHLSSVVMYPLCPGPTQHSYINWDLLPKGIRQTAEAVSSVAGWDRFSVLMACLGSVAMAMRGRYIIELDDFWKEPVILHQLLIAPSGQRKDLIVKIFKSEFDKFIGEKQCKYARNNPDVEMQKTVLRNAREKLKRAMIAKTISDSYDKESGSYDIASLPASVEEVVQGLQALDSEFEVRIGKFPLFLQSTQHSEG